jgi:signal peptidase II
LTRFYAGAATVLLLDQISKVVVRAHMTLQETIPLIGDLLRLRYVNNAGAAFGLFQGNRYLFIGISILAVVIVVYLVVTGRYTFRGSRIAFGLILGGALGNLVDRLWLTEVVDFIDIGIGVHRWPTFNVADIGVTLGVLYLAGSFLACEWEEKRKPPATPAQSGAPRAQGAPVPGASPSARPGDAAGSERKDG